MKILHLIEKGAGLQQADEGHLESFLWVLDEEEAAADYVAFHKHKTQRSWKGGRVLGIREATQDELTACASLKTPKNGSLVVLFEPVREYNGRPGVPWGSSRKSAAASKSLEEVSDDSAAHQVN